MLHATRASFPAPTRRLPPPLRGVALALGLFVAWPAAAQDFKAGNLTVTNPWSRAVPHGASVAAGYLTVHNAGNEPDRLVALGAEIAGRAEIHEMAVDGNGVMSMRQLPDGLTVPAGGDVALTPGSFHIMFLQLSAEPEQGKTFKGTLTFEKAGTVNIEYTVEALGGPARTHDAGSHGAGAHDAGAHGSSGNGGG